MAQFQCQIPEFWAQGLVGLKLRGQLSELGLSGVVGLGEQGPERGKGAGLRERGRVMVMKQCHCGKGGVTVMK